MLGRMAENLFWLSRYIERAENTARLLEVGHRMSMTSRREGSASEHLMSMMQAAEVDEAFLKKYDEADPARVVHFMLFDEDNLSSVKSCLMAARTNARSVRTALTTDLWESLNSAWLEFSVIRPASVTGSKLPALLTWIKKMSQQFRGALLGTQLRNDGFAFSQMGSFIERADNTARILDMKYFVLLPDSDLVGSDLDIQQWTMILRAASAHRSYRHFYHDSYKAKNVADYLIVRQEMPRSLAFCTREARRALGALGSYYSEEPDCMGDAVALEQMVSGVSVDAVIARGLHEFLTEFIERNNLLTARLGESYNFH